MALTESEILRRHTFYQTSYIGPRPVRSVYTPTLTVRKSCNQRQLKAKQNSPRKTKRATSCIDLTRDVETLDDRRDIRINRPRPWRETPKLIKRNENIQLHYENTLPKGFDGTNLKLKGREFVSNRKYGKLYILRQPTRPNSSRQRTPPTNTYVWEQDYLLWLTGTRDKYLEELTDRSKRSVAISDARDRYQCEPTSKSEVGGASGKSRDQYVENLTSRYKKSGVTDGSYWSVTSKLGYNKARANIEGKALKQKPAVHAYYNSYRLEKSRKQSSAVLIQRTFRGWNVRNLLKKIKRKALLENGQTLTKFVATYRETIAKVQRRYGNIETSCRLDLRQLRAFMDEKLKWEAAFKKLAVEGKLRKDDLMGFFNLCDFWPTQAEVDRHFDAIFRGSGNTADVIFVLDCSLRVVTTDSENILQFITDVVQGLDIGPDRIRVGILSQSSEPRRSSDIIAYSNKRGVLQAISRIKLRQGTSRTDETLKQMLHMLKTARPGVQKIGILLTAGKPPYSDRTETLAQQAKEAGVTMFAIGIGADVAETELSAIASSPRHVFTADNSSSLLAISAKLEAMFCLSACDLCQHILPRIARSGLLMSEALDLLWTAYPPAAAGIGVEKYLSLKTPVDPEMLEAGNSNVCLQRVIQAKLALHGYSGLPVDIRELIETATSRKEVLLILDNFTQKSLPNSQAE